MRQQPDGKQRRRPSMVQDIQVVEAEAGDAETVSRMVYAL